MSAKDNPPNPPGGNMGGTTATTTTTTPSPTPATTPTAMSYADRLKTNVKFDQRLKRNVLEITIERTDREKRIDMKPETVSRLLISIGLNVRDEMEGYQVTYGRICTISVWVKKGITLDRFCQKEGILVDKEMGLRTGTIRPAGRRDVLVTVAGVDYNTPDSLIQEYLEKFGGKLMNQNVIYGKYTEGPFIGKINNERKYEVDFSDAKTKMGTFHFIDGARVRIFYKGNMKTCGRCHQGQADCPGGGISKECDKNGGPRKLLTEHMKKIWSEIGFTPTTFKLPENVADAEDGQEAFKDGDKPMVEARDPPVKQPEITKEKLTGITINNLPKNITEEDMLKFLKENVKKDLDIVNFELTAVTSRNNASLTVFSGLTPDEIVTTMDKIDFKLGKEMFLERPLYCKALRTLTPSKEDAKKRKNSEEKEEAKDTEKEKKDDPENKDDSNNEDKNKDKHEEAFNKLKNEARLKHQTPRQKHGSMSDISQYLSPKPYHSLFGNYMEHKRGRKDGDESSDASPPGKPKNKKDKKNGKKEQHSSGIPKSSGGLAGSK